MVLAQISGRGWAVVGNLNGGRGFGEAEPGDGVDGDIGRNLRLSGGCFHVRLGCDALSYDRKG
jgi:hypothetical protein